MCVIDVRFGAKAAARARWAAFSAAASRAGRDVSFLVRLRRAGQLARDGLRIVSPHGDFAVTPNTILDGEIGEPFDLIGTRHYVHVI